LKVLVGCEFSGIVRNAFLSKGHDAISCDLLPTEQPGTHYQGDVRDLFYENWDLAILHPPCTYLAVSGNRWMKDNSERQKQREEAIKFFMEMVNAPITRIAVENPVSIMSTYYRVPDQYIQPYEFGHPETKKTSLWLKNLPLLRPTKIVEPRYILGKDGKRYSPTHYLSKGSAKKYFGMDRQQARSKTYTGIADAMAIQWGNLKHSKIQTSLLSILRGL
jgi:hypothetical protein